MTLENPAPKVYTERIRRTIARFPEKDCLHIKRGGVWQTWSYQDLQAEWAALVPALRRSGLAKGRHAIVIGENNPEWVIAYHAVILAGGVTVPVDPNLPAEEITEIARVTKPAVVFCAPVFSDLFQNLRKEGLFEGPIVALPPGDPTGPSGLRTFMATASPLANPFDMIFSPEDPAVVLFTSGTTGKSKGAVLVQRNFISAAEFGVPLMGLDHRQRTLAILPLHHVFGFAACIAIELLSGMDIVFVPIVKGPLIMEALNEKHATLLPGVPQMVELFHDNIKRTVRSKGPVTRALFSLLHFISRVFGPLLGKGFRRALFASVHRSFGGALQLIVSGGSSLRAAPFRAFQEMGFDIVEGYGLTETFGPITICPASDPRQGSVGRVIEGNEVRLHDVDGAGIGEVCFRGDTVFAGYYQNEEETRRVFDDAGWFHTGDLGRMSPDGFITLTGRIKDVIVLDSGKNVYPDEIEEYYLTHSEFFEEIGIFGLSRGVNEVAAAVIVPAREIRRRYPAEEAEGVIRGEISRLGRNLPSYKKISEFRLSYHPLPRTSTRKIQKPLLRIFFTSNAHKMNPTAQTVSENEITRGDDFRKIALFLNELSKGAHGGPITPRTLLDIDLQLDSLLKVELLTWLEKEFPFTPPENAMSRLENVGDILALLADSKTRGNTPAPVPPVSAGGPRATSPFLYPIGLWLIRLTSRLCWDLKTFGQNRVANRGGMIFCSNHESFLDIAWILTCLSGSNRRRTYVLGKAELYRNPVMRFLMAQAHVIAIERDGDVRATLRSAEGQIKAGHNLIIFPEGTRTRTGQLGRFRPGVGELILRTGGLAVPVRVRGGFNLWPAGAFPQFFFARKPGASVTFGDALDFSNAGPSTPYSAASVTELIRKSVERL